MKNPPPTLELFLDEISRLTGLPICIYDLRYFTQESAKMRVPYRLRIHCSPLCEKIKSNRVAWKKCIEIEYARAEAAAQSDEPFLHTCHAGLTDLIVPLHLGQQQIGALYLGQVITQPPARHHATLRRLARRYGFAPEELESISQQQMPHLPTSQLKTYSTILYLLQSYIEQAEELATHDDDVEPLMPKALRKSLPMEQVPTPVLDELRPDSAAIKKAVHILKTSYWKKTDLTSVAREVGMSQSHFSRQFRAETGLTFRDCLLKTRISAARFLLKKTDYSVNEIARVLGYSSAPALVRAFKTYTHCTPHKFLRRQSLPVNFSTEHMHGASISMEHKTLK